MTGCDMPEFQRDAMRKARKEHKCCECHGKIPPGTTYKLFTGKWSGEMQVFRMHQTCAGIVDAMHRELRGVDVLYDEMPAFGEMVERAAEDGHEMGDFPDYWPTGVYISSKALRFYVAEKEGIVAS